MKKYLPIGSVVLLSNSQKRVMIAGVKQKAVGDEKIWDYCGCLFPEGILDPEKLFLFDNEQIERLYFVGLQDAESMSYLQQLGKEADE